MTIAKQGAIVAGSFEMSWMVGTTSKTAVANGVSGAISGDATGTLDHVTGRFSMFPTVLPPVGTPIRYQWIKAGDKTEADLSDLSLGIEGNQVSGIIPDVPLIPGQTVFTLVLDIGDDADVVNPVTITVTDDGNGNLIHNVNNPIRVGLKLIAGVWTAVLNDSSVANTTIGAINYTTGAFVINAPGAAMFRVRKYSYRKSDDPNLSDVQRAHTYVYVWSSTVTESHPCNVRAPGLTKCQYLTTTTDDQYDITQALDTLSFDFTPNSRETVAQGSVRFTFGGRTYIDRQGYLYSNIDPLTGSGELSGTFDYSNGIAKITVWNEGATNAKVVVESMLTYLDDHTVSSITFRTPGAPVRPGSLYIQCLDADSVVHDITVPSSGEINSDIFDGTFDHETGICQMRFGYLVKASDYILAEWYDQNLVDVNGNIWMPLQVKADSLRFNCVTYSYLPLDADIIGLDPVRLPSDGKVPIIRKGYIGVIHSTKKTPFPNNVTAGYVLETGVTRMAKCWVEDADGVNLSTSLYTVDLDYGVVTLANPLDLTGYAQPLQAVHRIEDMSLITDVEISGRITLSKPLSHNYAAADTYVSTALIIDDTWARISNVFDQTTWTSVWSDTLIGSQSNAQFNNTDYPITVKNRGAITERFALIFTSSTAFNVIGEHLGLIATGTINEVCAPNNPNTSTPYFSINPLAWGAGWSTGNVLRFNLHGANAPFWLARTILQSEAAVESDEFSLQLRGNVNKD